MGPSRIMARSRLTSSTALQRGNLLLISGRFFAVPSVRPFTAGGCDAADAGSFPSWDARRVVTVFRRHTCCRQSHGARGNNHPHTPPQPQHPPQKLNYSPRMPQVITAGCFRGHKTLATRVMTGRPPAHHSHAPLSPHRAPRGRRSSADGDVRSLSAHKSSQSRRSVGHSSRE